VSPALNATERKPSIAGGALTEKSVAPPVPGATWFSIATGTMPPSARKIPPVTEPPVTDARKATAPLALAG